MRDRTVYVPSFPVDIGHEGNNGGGRDARGLAQRGAEGGGREYGIHGLDQEATAIGLHADYAGLGRQLVVIDAPKCRQGAEKKRS